MARETRNLIALLMRCAAGSGCTGVVMPAQTPQAFTLTLPLQVDIMTNVAVR